MNKYPVILDTDPGIDDAIAIIVLLSYAREQVKLVLASYGNISVDHTTNNALTMLSLCHCDDIPVVKGTAHPDNDHYVDAANIHGSDGLFGLKSDRPCGQAVIGDYLQITYDAIVAQGMVDYIVLGPLTNLALLIKRFPDVLDHIHQVIIMGGGLTFGNVTKEAEFNIHCDAESAQYVFDTVPKLVMAALDVTTSVAFTLEQIADIQAIGTPLAQSMAFILEKNYHTCVAYGEPGATMHDSTAVVYYLFPELFEVEWCGISVDCITHYGKTIRHEDQKNIGVIVKTDPQDILQKIHDSIED